MSFKASLAASEFKLIASKKAIKELSAGIKVAKDAPMFQKVVAVGVAVDCMFNVIEQLQENQEQMQSMWCDLYRKILAAAQAKGLDLDAVEGL